MSVARAAARRPCARSWWRSSLALVPLLISTLVLAGCDSGDRFPQTTFRPVSAFGDALNRVFYNTFGWTMAILVLVVALILFAAFRFRERPGTPTPAQVHGNTKLEIAWTIAPAVAVVFMGVPTVQTIFETQRRPPEDALVVEVIGHQWWWEFRYPQYQIVTANQMWIPTDRPVSLHMRSADVIHSFWIPKIGGKRDVNPLPRRREGEPAMHDNYLLFTVREPGHYLGQCAEYCGEAHGIMRMTTMAVTAPEFEAWVQRMRTGGPQAAGAVPPRQDTAAAPPPQQPLIGQMPAPTGAGNPFRAPMADTMLQAEGKRIFLASTCVACHTIAGTSAAGPVGPDLTMMGTRPWLGAGAAENDRENLIRWIRDPQVLKPGALMPGTTRGGGGMAPTGLTDQEVRAVAAYLASLK